MAEHGRKGQMVYDNFDEPVAITRDIFWVGFSDVQTKLHCNPYLLVEEEESILIDPGSIPDFPKVMRKVIDVVDPHSISHIIAQHQDPDVCGNLPVTEDIVERSDLKIVAHRNTARLIRHLGLRSEFYHIDDHDNELVLKSGRRIEFMFTPYLHSPGAIVTYDRNTRTLFSSDIFGGYSEEWSLFPKGDEFLEGMMKFHQLYMPSNAILRRALEQMEQRWSIERILPQHGCVLEGENIGKAMSFLKQLPCGIDLG